MKFKLYIEGIKQLRVIGIMALVIFSFEAIFMGIARGITEDIYFNEMNINIVSIFDIHPIIVLSFAVLAPLMTLYLFSFLNKRNACDFYHSTPVTRKSLFLFYFLAIITWIIFILLFSTGVSIITSLFFKSVYSISLYSVFLTLFNVFAASLLVIAATSVAMCITGTIFTNIIVTGIILFIPRLLITFVLFVVSSELPMIVSGKIIPFLDLKYNIVCSSVFNLFISPVAVSSSFTQISCGIYTMILALLYVFVAFILFKRRKSEAAGLSAPNDLLQAVYRIIIALTVSLIPIYFIFDFIMEGNEFLPETILVTSVSYICALILVIVFELISTKKVRNILKVFPSLGIVIALNVIIVISMLGIQKTVLNTTPNTKEIDYINILSTSVAYFGDDIDYFGTLSSQVNLESDKIKEIISEALKNNIKTYKKSEEDYFKLQNLSSHSIIVSIKHGLFTSERIVILTKSEYNALINELDKDKDYSDIFINLPELDNSCILYFNSDTVLDKESFEEIYNTMRDEISQLSLENVLYLFDTSNYEMENSLGYFELNSMFLKKNINGSTYSLYLPINSLLPKTCTEYFKQIENENKKYFKKFISLTEQLPENGKDFNFSITTTNMTPSDNGGPVRYYNFYWSDEENNNIKEEFIPELTDCIEIIKKSESVPDDLSKPYLNISVYYYDTEKENNIGYSFYLVPNSDEEVLTLENLLNSFSDDQNSSY